MNYKYVGSDYHKETKGKKFILTGERREIKSKDYFLGMTNNVCYADKDYNFIAAIAKEVK